MADYNDVFTTVKPPPWLTSDEENPSSSTNWHYRPAPVLGVPGVFDPDGFNDLPSTTSDRDITISPILTMLDEAAKLYGMESYDGSG